MGLVSSTRQAYRTGQPCFVVFCTSSGLLHPLGSCLLASDSTLELLPVHLASSISFQTFKCYLAVVRALQIKMGFSDPLASSPHLERVLWVVKPAQAARNPPNPPGLPVTRDMMLLLCSSLSAADPHKVMLWAAFTTAWFGFL